MSASPWKDLGARDSATRSVLSFISSSNTIMADASPTRSRWPMLTIRRGEPVDEIARSLPAAIATNAQVSGLTVPRPTAPPDDAMGRALLTFVLIGARLRQEDLPDRGHRRHPRSTDRHVAARRWESQAHGRKHACSFFVGEGFKNFRIPLHYFNTFPNRCAVITLCTTLLSLSQNGERARDTGGR